MLPSQPDDWNALNHVSVTLPATAPRLLLLAVPLSLLWVPPRLAPQQGS